MTVCFNLVVLCSRHIALFLIAFNWKKKHVSCEKRGLDYTLNPYYASAHAGSCKQKYSISVTFNIESQEKTDQKLYNIFPFGIHKKKENIWKTLSLHPMYPHKMYKSEKNMLSLFGKFCKKDIEVTYHVICDFNVLFSAQLQGCMLSAFLPTFTQNTQQLIVSTCFWIIFLVKR